MSKSGEGLSHLAPAMREVLLLSDEARIKSMQRDRWIDYARGTAVRDRLTRLLATPERDRMPCLLLHGESNIGKTQIVRKFVRDHPSTFDEQGAIAHLLARAAEIVIRDRSERLGLAHLEEVAQLTV